MENDLAKGAKALTDLLRAVGINPPPLLLKAAAWVSIGLFALTAVNLTVKLISETRARLPVVFPFLFSVETRRRLRRRRRFAEHIESEMRRLDREQLWSDFRFAELEAEVEAEGRRRCRLFFGFTRRAGLRHEASLTRALARSHERLVLIEGDPGAGKSVALRHVTTKLARKARLGGSHSLIPLYLNLRELARPADSGIDAELIRGFVIRALNRPNDRDIAEFLEQELVRGMEEGTWLFLFDSFDEIPEVLGSVEPDAFIHSYEEAIHDFLHGLNQCRGAVASRAFRGPGQAPWPKFRILALSEQRRTELVKRAELPADAERELRGRLPLAMQELGSLAQNPLFLSLLCEHMRLGNPFPATVHAVFETYVGERLSRDRDRISVRYGIEPPALRATAESVAFCMAIDPSLGLMPSREAIAEGLVRHHRRESVSLERALDALEFIKLARAEHDLAQDAPLFSFAHRRFQEYFSTCVVLRQPDLVSPAQLLCNGRWRETAVVIFQTGRAESLRLLLEKTQALLAVSVLTPAVTQAAGPSPFGWPQRFLHIVGVLQDGFRGRTGVLPVPIRFDAGRILVAATRSGTLMDRKWALEVAGPARQEDLLEMLRGAFKSSSQWLSEVAYRQVARLRSIPPDISRHILAALLRLHFRRWLLKERLSTRAHLLRLPQPHAFLRTFRLLLLLPLIDLALLLSLFLVLVLNTSSETFEVPASYIAIVLIAFGMVPFWIDWTRVRRKMKLLGSDGAIGVILAFRCGLILAVSLGVHSVSTLLLATYLALWTPAAAWVARGGRWTDIAWWPVLPFVALWTAPFRKAVAVIGRLFKRRQFRWSLAGIGASLLMWIWLISMANDLSNAAEHRTEIISKLWGLVGSVFFLSIWSVLLVRRGLAWHSFRRTMRRSSMSPQDFVASLRVMALNSYRQRFVSRVRELSLLLPPSADAEQIVRALAIAVERSWTRRDGGSVGIAPSEAAELCGISLAQLASFSPEVLDELCRLQESLRAADGCAGAAAEE